MVSRFIKGKMFCLKNRHDYLPAVLISLTVITEKNKASIRYFAV